MSDAATFGSTAFQGSLFYSFFFHIFLTFVENHDMCHVTALKQGITVMLNTVLVACAIRCRTLSQAKF